MKYRSDKAWYGSGGWVFGVYCGVPLVFRESERVVRRVSRRVKKRVVGVRVLVCGCGEVFVEGVGCGGCRYRLRVRG